MCRGLAGAARIRVAPADFALKEHECSGSSNGETARVDVDAQIMLKPETIANAVGMLTAGVRVKSCSDTLCLRSYNNNVGDRSLSVQGHPSYDIILYCSGDPNPKRV